MKNVAKVLFVCLLLVLFVSGICYAEENEKTVPQNDEISFSLIETDTGKIVHSYTEEEIEKNNKEFEACDIVELTSPEIWVECVTARKVALAKELRNNPKSTWSEQQLVSLLWLGHANNFKKEEESLIQDLMQNPMYEDPALKKLLKSYWKNLKSLYKSLNAFYKAQSKSALKNVYIDKKASKKMQKAILKFREGFEKAEKKFAETSEKELQEYRQEREKYLKKIEKKWSKDKSSKKGCTECKSEGRKRYEFKDFFY